MLIDKLSVTLSGAGRMLENSPPFPMCPRKLLMYFTAGVVDDDPIFNGRVRCQEYAIVDVTHADDDVLGLPFGRQSQVFITQRIA